METSCQLKRARVSPGLVHLSTSQTPPPGLNRAALKSAIALDTAKARLTRMKRGLITGARLHQQAVSRAPLRHYCVMVTLTYAPEVEYSPKHISRFLDATRKHLKRRGVKLRCAWAAELTKKGKLHYHVLIWLPTRLRLPKPDRAGWWTYGMTRIEKARNAVGYLAKYASKGPGSGELPRGCRIYAVSGLCSRDAQEKRYWLSPKWVRDVCDISDDPARIPGGGFVLRSTGEYLRSPWLVVSIEGILSIVKVTYDPTEH